VIDMWWRDVLFAHWPATDALERLIPRGLTLDRFEGTPWLSVVPFRMTAVHARFAPVLPGFGAVSEINLRTYVSANGRPGVLFFSLDADEPLVVRSARLTTGLPYFDARIVTNEDERGINYRSERTQRGLPGGRFAARYRPTGDAFPAKPGTIEAFLHERYTFYNERRGKIHAADVRHDVWSLHRAEIDVEENSLGALAAQDLPGAPALCFFARELRVRATATGALATNSG
jgi:uncharacterized protein YqjF (DUF2071 family)